MLRTDSHMVIVDRISQKAENAVSGACYLKE